VTHASSGAPTLHLPGHFEIAPYLASERFPAARRHRRPRSCLYRRLADHEMQQQLKSAERIKAAAKIAAEIAQRSAIPGRHLGAVQVIHAERRALLGDERVAELLTVERRKAFDQIIGCPRLDKIIERFINFTEFTPEH
jgi:hypothetical protein